MNIHAFKTAIAARKRPKPDFTLDKEIGESMRQLRENKGVTLAALGKALNMSGTYIWGLELGQRHWSNELIDKISLHLESIPDKPVATPLTDVSK